MHRIDVLASEIAYLDEGEGPPVVFLHGNPTSSHAWRNVLPVLTDRARCLAPDLIGMGRSGRPDIAYRFADHARYFDAWMAAMRLGPVVLVGTDWGGALAMDWAARHPDRIRGLVVFETFMRPMGWADWPPEGATLFRSLRTPGEGERIVLTENRFLAQSLAHGVRGGVSDEVRAAYHAPYPTPESRRPLLQWTREIPIDGEPSDVHAAVEAYDRWLATSVSVPKLLITFEAPSVLGSPAVVEWAREHVSRLDVVALGHAGHHATEDDPEGIGRAIRAWLTRHQLTTRIGVAPLGSYVRVDTFRVSDAARARLLEASQRILAFLSTLDGFVGSSLLERRAGDTRGDLVTLVAWRSREAAEAAGPRVREFLRASNLDVPRLLSELGVEMTRADYEVTSVK
ncbi:MAG: haloalkane dehalogenase [Labilithrix sp.]|nr:haloalkane dehalogenase [Labilithrix sp.]